MRKLYLFIAVALMSLTTAMAQNPVQEKLEAKAASAKKATTKYVLKSAAQSNYTLSKSFNLEGLKNTKPADASAAAAKGARAAAATSTLPANRKYMGAYSTDEYAAADKGHGADIFGYDGELTIGAFMPIDYLTKYVGGKIVGMRFALANPTNVYRVSVYTVSVVGDKLQISEQPALNKLYTKAATAGWNTVLFDKSLVIDNTSAAGYIVTFSYEHSSDITAPAGKALSFVENGDFLNELCFYGPFYEDEQQNPIEGWYIPGFESSLGNLSVQAIVEKDAFDCKDVQMQNMLIEKDWIKSGEVLNYAVLLNNFGTQTINNLVIGTFIDDNEVEENTLTNVTSEGMACTGTVAIGESLSAGEHTLKIRVKEIDGVKYNENDEIYSDDWISYRFFKYNNSVARQKTLMEQFTSQYCGNCPDATTYLKNFTNGRNDIAWVSIHGDMSSGTDQFTVNAGDQIMIMENMTFFPSASFNRTVINGSMVQGINRGEQGPEYYNQYYGTFVDFSLSNSPALATVNITGSYDEATRKLNVTVSGDAAEPEVLKQLSYGVTVYLTESGIVARQGNSSGVWVTDYVHDHVLRMPLSDVFGDAVDYSTGKYSKTYTATLSEEYNAENMEIVAFVAPRVRNINDFNPYNLWVTNANTLSVKSISTGINGVSANDAEAVEVARYNAAGQVISAPQKGLNIIKLSNGKTMKVIVKE